MKATKMVAVSLLCLPAVALAVPVTYEFSGSVTFTDDPLHFDHGVGVGSAFSGSFTFDDAVAPAFSGADYATYLDLVSQFDVSFDGLAVTSADRPVGPSSPQRSEAQVSNNRSFDGADAFGFQAAVAPLASDPSHDLFFRNVQFQGVTSNSSTFLSTALPTTLDLAAFDVVPLMLSVTYQVWSSPNDFISNGQIAGRVTSLRVSGGGSSVSVPEPSALVLMGAGLGMLLTRRRRAVPCNRA
jgi:hypothetical protein